MSLTERRVGWRLILAVTTALGIFSSIQAFNYVTFFSTRKPETRFLVLLNMSYWYGWAVLVPGVLWLARRYRFERPTWRRAALAHTLGVAVFTFMHAVITVSMRAPVTAAMGWRSGDWVKQFQQLFFFNFDWDMMTYWAIVGFSHALDYHRQAQERTLAAAQLQTRLAEAQLEALQRQLHPHFLFNTLHTISALMHRNVEAADAMLARLSDLLRQTLDRIGIQEIPLKEELEFLDTYLEIERTRFGERLTVVREVEPEALDVLVPTQILQPLVENAIRHGIAPRVGGGRLQLVARRTGDRLWLMVRDDGPGLSSQAKLEAFTSGVGVSNTRSRLEHLYPGAHRFEFHEPSDGGLAVTIEIPADRLGEPADGATPSNMESVA